MFNRPINALRVGARSLAIGTVLVFALLAGCDWRQATVGDIREANHHQERLLQTIINNQNAIIENQRQLFLLLRKGNRPPE